MALSNEKAEIVKLFFDLGKAFKSNMRKSFLDEGLTMPQGFVINILMRNGQRMKMTDLSKNLNLSNSTVSGIVDRMEKMQLVERERSEEDRRIVYVKITPKYNEMHQETHKKLEKAFEKLMDSGSPEDIAKISDGLNTLKRMLEQCGKKST